MLRQRGVRAGWRKIKLKGLLVGVFLAVKELYNPPPSPHRSGPLPRARGSVSGAWKEEGAGDSKELEERKTLVPTHHGSGKHQHHAARGGSATGVVGDEASEDPPCEKEGMGVGPVSPPIRPLLPPRDVPNLKCPRRQRGSTGCRLPWLQNELRGERRGVRRRFPRPRPARSCLASPKTLTDIDDVEGQPVEEGVAHQFGKEEAQGELHHTLGGEKTSEAPLFPSTFSRWWVSPPIPVPIFYPCQLTGMRSAPRKLMASGSSAGSLGLSQRSV